ncbi:MAG TPA: DoxX family protein [Gemmatimonadales bacterium]
MTAPDASAFRPRAPNAPAATILIRLMVGGVFLAEGLQKFLYPAEVGAGRFARIGIPSPGLMGPLVGALETVCGLLVLLGLYTRIAVVPLIAIMVVAFVATKLPILLGSDLGPFQVRELPYYGFWGFAHESRTDLSMAMGSLFLLLVGPGRWSLDAWLSRRRTRGAAGTGDASQVDTALPGARRRAD